MEALILFGSVVLIGAMVRKHCCTRLGIVLNPVLTFSLGFLFYWVVPLVLGASRLFMDQPGMAQWYNVFDRVRPAARLAFTLFSVASYLAFVSGYNMGVIRGQGLRRRVPRAVPAALLWPTNFPVIVFALALAWLLRANLFRGYLTGAIYAGAGLQGSFAATSVAMCAIFLLALASNHARTGLRLKEHQATKAFLLWFVVSAVLVLSLGGRLSI